LPPVKVLRFLGWFCCSVTLIIVLGSRLLDEAADAAGRSGV
jgi:hypothetical protein